MHLPPIRPDKNVCDAPHVFILGAGASRAACPRGDALGRPLPVMTDLVAATKLTPILKSVGVSWEGRNFEELYQGVAENDELGRVVEAHIRQYFEALVLPPTATLYDRILLSLRSKDVIATFNWDPLLAQAFSRNRHIAILPRILFLHGNVAVGICERHRKKGFIAEHRCDTCGEPFTPSRLLYPVSVKNYSDDMFIANEWSEARDAISKAYLLTIIGYAAPASDIEAKTLLLEAWQSNGYRTLGEVDVIDIKPKREVERDWKAFFKLSHSSASADPDWLFAHPRRSCDHFAMATLQQRPCRSRPFPKTDNLRELQDWVAPLVEQEEALVRNGTPLIC